MDYSSLIYGCAAVLCAALLAFTMTPIVRVLAFRIGAIDVPADERRMHKKPIPRIGGLAIFFAFVITTIAFCEVNPTMLTLWFGGLVLVCMGVLDDVFRLNAWIKLVFQIAVAFIAVYQGVTIDYINFFGTYVNFGIWSIPITVIWIVGLTNAINIIDGLDGLACGVSIICSLSLFCVALISSQPIWALLTAILVGSCAGFLPFNRHPAKIFMGDTGALFLGFTLSILSIEGIFKTHMLLSFLIPLSIFGLPLFDTAFAIIRRILRGESPFAADGEHIHHKLMKMGFGQKYSVRILYAVCGILGISAVMFTHEKFYKTALIAIVGFALFILMSILFKNEETRRLTGMYDDSASTENAKDDKDDE